jgi:hypothetical protein
MTDLPATRDEHGNVIYPKMSADGFRRATVMIHVRADCGKVFCFNVSISADFIADQFPDFNDFIAARINEHGSMLAQEEGSAP